MRLRGVFILQTLRGMGIAGALWFVPDRVGIELMSYLWIHINHRKVQVRFEPYLDIVIRRSGRKLSMDKDKEEG